MGKEFGVQRVYPPNYRFSEGPYGDVQIFATKAQAKYHAHVFTKGTYRILVRDVSEWRDA